ncbi:MAG TPA: class I SAM-dependent methyltransferase [Blastocatellia bacterium]|jgi:SAM-dependent methyltransferase|nr:class I SAM-dependent methyltransferase [Blastocatellia bacterium]
MRPEEYQAMFDLEEHLWWYDGMREITTAILETGLGNRRDLRLLDVGCGTGYSLQWLGERFKPGLAFGIDAAPSAAKFWKLRELSTASVASACSLPLRSNEFDLATCFDVLYQFSRKDAESAVAEVHRVLKPGGSFLLREPAYNWMRGGHDLAVGTRHRFTLTELRHLLSGSGFKLKKATYANTLLFWAAIPHRLLSRISGGSRSDVKPVPEWRNRILANALKVEARLLRRLAFPFGLSAILLAEKQDDA